MGTFRRQQPNGRTIAVFEDGGLKPPKNHSRKFIPVMKGSTGFLGSGKRPKPMDPLSGTKRKIKEQGLSITGVLERTREMAGYCMVGYHDACGDVWPGLGRSACNAGEVGKAEIILRIRTQDTRPNVDQIIAKLEKSGIKAVLSRGYEIINYPVATIRLEITRMPGKTRRYYSVYMQGVPVERLKDAMQIVDTVAAELLKAKEISQGLADDIGTGQLKKELGLARPVNQTKTLNGRKT